MTWGLVVSLGALAAIVSAFYFIYRNGAADKEKELLKREVRQNAEVFRKAQQAAMSARESAKSVCVSDDPNNRDNWVQ